MLVAPGALRSVDVVLINTPRDLLDRTTAPVAAEAAAMVTAEALRALVADLTDIAIDLEAGGYSATMLAMFERDLRRVVPSALGATISVALEEPDAGRLEINLIDGTLEPAEISSGLRLSLSAFRPSIDGSILFYAGAPAAFTEFARCLLLLLPPQQDHLDQFPILPPGSLSSSVAGLQDFSLVNQAIGVLLNRGYTLKEARDDLQDRAGRAQTGLAEAAQSLLDTFASRGREFENDSRPRDRSRDIPQKRWVGSDRTSQPRHPHDDQRRIAALTRELPRRQADAGPTGSLITRADPADLAS